MAIPVYIHPYEPKKIIIFLTSNYLTPQRPPTTHTSEITIHTHESPTCLLFRALSYHYLPVGRQKDNDHTSTILDNLSVLLIGFEVL